MEFRFALLRILMLLMISSSPSFAEEIAVIKGDDFKMLCYAPPGVSNYYIELKFISTSPTSTETTIGKFDPQTGIIKIPDDQPQYKNRLLFSMTDYTSTVLDVGIEDEGTYTCYVTGFSVVGSPKMTNNLVVYVRPVIEITRMNDPLLAGSQLIDAASCSATNGKPAAKVTWSSGRNLQFNQTHSLSTGTESGTTTNVSTLSVAPTKFYNQQPFHCEVTHPALENGGNVSMLMLDVRYPPSVPTIIVINKNTQLECTADGNPPPTIKWIMPNNNPSPDSNVVRIISPTDPARQNDTYECTATNGIDPPTSKIITTAEAVTYVEMVKSSNTGMIVGAVVGSIAVLLVIAALVYWFFIRKHREKDSGPYNPKQITRQTNGDDEGGWSRSSGRPMIQHANESLNKNAPPSPTHPPPQDDDEGSENSQSDVEEFTEGHDVDLNSPLTGGDDDDPTGAIVSKNSVNFQPYWRNSVAEHRRQRPSTSPHRRSQNRSQPEPAPRTPQQSDPHYEVPPKEYYEDDYDHDDAHLMGDQHHPQDDDRFYDLPEDRYPGYQPRYDEPPHHDDNLPPYTDNVQYASIDHDYNDGKPRTRPPYHEPVEYAEIRSKGQIV